jgi:hypothetical protein
MKDTKRRYAYTVYPDNVEALSSVLQKVLSLLAATYNCPIQYRVTESGMGIVVRPVEIACDPKIDLLKLRCSFTQTASEVCIMPTPCDFGSWAALFSATIDRVTFSVNLHLLPE